ncbi:hypothetical protein GCM10010371_08200 [Streptomyces subrutilus]|uniref:Uncharacterized protein n=1 Tax=Streptomyces subrutilus TaxID=36818 RepID=A0A5P2UTL1_9ACTN|nr:hypothetical protein [Streptomyces subrutilus]QEU80047.1 hypothetical protein CP968_18580 [Streptomyces subrutilus]GGZ50870.1 hypothetical protein GCM10010371_08200 [Streptomyces subrutilus]
MDSSHELETVTPSTVVESLRESLMAAGIVLPSLGIDPAPPRPGLVRLGSVRPDVALKLAQVVKRRHS